MRLQMFEYLRFNWLYPRVSVHKSDILKILRQCVSFFFFSSNFPCFFLFSQNLSMRSSYKKISGKLKQKEKQLRLSFISLGEIYKQNQLKNFETRRVFRGGACFISKQRNSSIKIRSLLLASRVLDALLFSRAFFLSFLERRLLNRLFFLACLAWAGKRKKKRISSDLFVYIVLSPLYYHHLFLETLS